MLADGRVCSGEHRPSCVGSDPAPSWRSVEPVFASSRAARQLVGAAGLLVSKRPVPPSVCTVIGTPAPKPQTARRSRRPRSAPADPAAPSRLGIYQRVQVRAPGETPYFRSGDACCRRCAQIAVPASSRRGRRPGAGTGHRSRLVRTHIVTVPVPAARRRHVNRAIILSSATRCRPLQRRGLGSRSFVCGLLRAEFVNPRPVGDALPFTRGASRSTCNSRQRLRRAAAPGPRLVGQMERFGFIWGGTFSSRTATTSSTAAPPPHVRQARDDTK